MCFNVSVVKFAEYLEKRFQAKLKDSDLFKPVYHTTAFGNPILPVIANSNQNEIELFRWGLIPFWVKNKEQAEKIRSGTYNARAETIFEKPSFKNSIINKRCMVLVDGFFEWHDFNAKKYPFYIHLKNNEAFAIAGIWDVWTSHETNEIMNTFSIITTEANPLLEKIHNVKKRMPVILSHDDEKKWLTSSTPSEIKSFLKPYGQNDLEAYPVSNLISRRNVDSNSPAVLERFDYSN